MNHAAYKKALHTNDQWTLLALLWLDSFKTFGQYVWKTFVKVFAIKIRVTYSVTYINLHICNRLTKAPGFVLVSGPISLRANAEHVFPLCLASWEHGEWTVLKPLMWFSVRSLIIPSGSLVKRRWARHHRLARARGERSYTRVFVFISFLFFECSKFWLIFECAVITDNYLYSLYVQLGLHGTILYWKTAPVGRLNINNGCARSYWREP